jgi:squalene cyclase
LWRRLGLPDTEWKPLAQQLRSAQNSDGGWSQITKAKSDAYATGQALYALAEAGAKPDDDAVRRAQAFLAKTQRQDGGWAMTSRGILPSGKVATKLEPITHAGSAWAVLGLIRTAGGVAKVGSTPPK